MLLTRLVQFADSHPDVIPPPFHIRDQIRWLLDLDAQGLPVTGDLVALRDPGDPQGRKGLPQTVPTVGRTSA